MKQRTKFAQNSGAPAECRKEWRTFFSDAVLKKAWEFITFHQFEDVAFAEREAHAIIGQGAAMGRALIRNAPASCSDEWDTDNFSCSCRTVKFGQRGTVCVHEAALLTLWERRRGPWVFRETEEESRARIRREEEARRAEQERLRREEQRKAEGKIFMDAASFFPARSPSGAAFYFQARRAVENCSASLYALRRAREILRDGEVTMNPPQILYTDDGRQALSVSGEASDSLERRAASVTFSPETLLHHRCECRAREFRDDAGIPLCEHELALLQCAQDYIDRENPGDATDRAAEQFFVEMDSAQPAPETTESNAAESLKKPCVTLLPRITLDMGEAKLSFKVGVDKKFIILKNLREFAQAVEAETRFTLSKTLDVDFSAMTFTEESFRWLTFIQRRISETDIMNDRLQSRAYSYWNAPATINVLHQDALKGAALDRFYEMAEGSECEFVDRARKEISMTKVGHVDMKLRLTSQRIADADGNFLGIAVSGDMPFILKGSSDTYLLNAQSLSRLTKEEASALRPFQSSVKPSGEIRLLIGMSRLAEFYYRVAPRLLESPYIDFTDQCEKEAETVLPPEPAFLFRIDLEDDCFLEEYVTYGGGEPLRLPRGAAPRGYFDALQESRVAKVILRYFPRFDEQTRAYHSGAGEDELYRILTEGAPELSRYGEVQGSAAFLRCVTRPLPPIHIGVSVESGLLDISVLSKDIPARELLDVLESYRRKKTFHRLKNGDFVTLSGDGQLASLESMMRELNLSEEEVIRGHMELPLFRALYLDSMLEKHHDLASNRDRTYRALLRGFRTIRDADYEVPSAQSDILRPYQVYGYKWLRTLDAAGFGGILADEMGLGKTLQAITFLQALKESGDSGPNLIVCPASLVYNWQEEFSRFAPSLNVLPVAGPAPVRKAYLADAQSDDVDAYITSYDLLRQDIAAYEKMRFSVMILDEAQYIKNQKAGMTKAVKIIRARTRLALTGTPIENRLAELWSIFDFLMPGFLYSYPEFLRKFETPITKNHEPIPAERLKRMTAPFILRRLKSDVLKDLPPKLEEVRYSRFESEQRKIYDGQVIRMKQIIAQSGQSGEERMRIFAELMRIRQICCDPGLIFEDYRGGSAKRDACMELVRNAIGGGHRMLIFSQFASMLALLEEDLNKERIAYYKIVGATSKEQRLRLVKAFNEGDTPVFLISLKAGGTGLNLTGADVVIHYDPWWNVAAQNQATDRAHRIGQRNQVTVYRMIVKGTIEEKILAMQEAKRDLAEAILSGEGESLFSLSNEELLGLLE